VNSDGLIDYAEFLEIERRYYIYIYICVCMCVLMNNVRCVYVRISTARCDSIHIYNVLIYIQIRMYIYMYKHTYININLHRFPIMLFPAFRLQDAMQRNSLGVFLYPLINPSLPPYCILITLLLYPNYTFIILLLPPIPLLFYSYHPLLPPL
jgi:hypothetical protein